MKISLSAIAGLCLLAFGSFGQTISHPVIEKIQVMYKPVQAGQLATTNASAPVIKVKATANITLKDAAGVSRINLKVVDKQSQAVVYQVSYAVTASDVSDNGLVLYHKQGNTFLITNPATLILKPYIYELYTEDAEGARSSVYTITQ